MRKLDFSSTKEICGILHKISDQFEEDSDEARAIEAAAGALISQTMEQRINSLIFS